MTILLTKVRAPQRRKDVLRRVRLVDALHQNIHRKLTFVSAPAGYGKTTLLVDFAADLDAIVCWYRIGPEDNDLVQFVSHIVAAFQQQIPQFGRALQERLESSAAAPDSPSLATDLINEIQQKVEDFCVLVLDDYHLAGEDQQIVDFVENFLENLPDQLRILIGSRSVYGIPTASLYIHDELVTISADELRFRADELQKLVLQNYRIRLPLEQAHELAKRADGWIIALLLAVRTMENGALPRLTGGIEQVYEYLAEEVVSRQSPGLRDFMLAVSILGDFNETLCNYLLEIKDSAVFLRALEDRNLFVSRTETREGASFRFHQLFSEFLLDYFARHQPMRKQILHRRAAQWHKARKDWENAIQQKLAAGDREEAAAWMDAVAEKFYTSDRPMLLARWLDHLSQPPDCRPFAPHLLLFQAKSLVNQSHFEQSLKFLDIAEPLLAQQKDIAAVASALITRGMVNRFTGKYRDALSLAENTQQELLKTKATKKHHPQTQWYQAERLKAIPAFFLGSPQKGIEHLKTAIRGFRRQANSTHTSARGSHLYNLAECLNDLGLIYISLGQMLSAQKTFQEALDIHINLHSNLGALASARNNVAYIQHQVGHYAEAWKTYAQALENAKNANRPREQIAILNGRGDLLIDLGEIEKAKANYQGALELGKGGQKPELVATYVGLGKVERLSKHYNEAMNWLRKAASYSPQALDKVDYAVELGTIYSEMGQGQLALKQFDLATASWPPEKSLPKPTQALAALLSAAILYERGAKEKALSCFERSMTGAAQLGYDQFLLAPARAHIENLEKLAASRPSAQVKNFLQRVKNFKSGLSGLEAQFEKEEPPQIHLEIHALNNGAVYKNGELLPSTIWRSSQAQAMFFYILDHGKVRKGNIALDFWPDFGASRVSSNFHATLWRVRHAIGFKDAILFEESQYSLHPQIQMWYDVTEFQNYLLQTASPQISITERTEFLRRATELYQTPYLPDLFTEWANERRQELQNYYLDALIGLATLELGAKHYREARGLFEKAIAIEPYRDAAHLALMKCLVESGSAAAAITHFEQYKGILRKDLNAKPSPELQEYYEQVAIRA